MYGPLYLIAILICIGKIPSYKKAVASTDGCGDDTSMSTMEERFHIDIAAIEHLSFTSSKMIDLGWDIVVGQGGRLLHGWILYHVAAETITSILETSSLPYSVLFDLMFYVDSISSFWSLLLLLGKNRGARIGVLVRSLLLSFAIAHVLFFAAIWSAATGYQSPGVITYAMPDQSWVTKNSDELRICRQLKVQRPELRGFIDGPILGPNYGEVFSSFADIVRDPFYMSLPDDYGDIENCKTQ